MTGTIVIHLELYHFITKITFYMALGTMVRICDDPTGHSVGIYQRVWWYYSDQIFPVRLIFYHEIDDGLWMDWLIKGLLFRVITL